MYFAAAQVLYLSTLVLKKQIYATLDLGFQYWSFFKIEI